MTEYNRERAFIRPVRDERPHLYVHICTILYQTILTNTGRVSDIFGKEMLAFFLVVFFHVGLQAGDRLKTHFIFFRSSVIVNLKVLLLKGTEDLQMWRQCLLKHGEVNTQHKWQQQNQIGLLLSIFVIYRLVSFISADGVT